MAFIQVDALKVDSGDAKMAGIGAALSTAGQSISTWAQSKYEAEMREYSEKRKATIDMQKLKFDSAKTALMAEQEYQDTVNKNIAGTSLLNLVSTLSKDTTAEATPTQSEQDLLGLNKDPIEKTAQNIMGQYGPEIGDTGKADATPLTVGAVQSGIPYLSTEKDEHGNFIEKRHQISPQDAKLLQGSLTFDSTAGLSIDDRVVQKISLPSEILAQYNLKTFKGNISQVDESMKFKDSTEKSKYYANRAEAQGSAVEPVTQNEAVFHIGITEKPKSLLKAEYEMLQKEAEAAKEAYKFNSPLDSRESTSVYSGVAGGTGGGKTAEGQATSIGALTDANIQKFSQVKKDIMSGAFKTEETSMIPSGYDESIKDDFNSTPLPSAIVSYIKAKDKNFSPKKEGYSRKEFYELATKYGADPSSILSKDKFKNYNSNPKAAKGAFDIADAYMQYMKSMGSKNKNLQFGGGNGNALNPNTVTSKSNSFVSDLTREQYKRVVAAEAKVAAKRDEMNTPNQNVIEKKKYEEFKKYANSPYFRNDFKAVIVTDKTEVITGEQMKKFVKDMDEKK